MVVGGLGVSLHISHKYLDSPLNTSHKNYHKCWFYVRNHASKLPEFMGQRLTPRLEWMSDPAPKFLEVVLAAMKRIMDMKDLRLTVVHVVGN